MFKNIKRWIILLTMVAVGLTTTTYLLFVLYENDSERNTEARIRATELASEISSRISTDINSFNYLADYIGAVSERLNDSFSEVSINYLDQNITSQILMYAPKITPTMLDEYLASIDPLGNPKKIAQYRADGLYEEALVFDQSFPIDLIENFSKDTIPYGIDLSSNLQWTGRLAVAKDSGLPTTLNVQLNDKHYYWVIRAIYEKNDKISGELIGYLVASVDIQQTISTLFEDQENSKYLFEINNVELEKRPANHVLNKLQADDISKEVYEYRKNSIILADKQLEVVIKGTALDEFQWSLEYSLIAILGVIVTALLVTVFWSINSSAENFRGLYDELRESQDQLIQSEKMASLGQMVAGVAHEMNTPLGFISNNVSMINDYVLNIQDVINSLSVINSGSKLNKDELIIELKKLIRTYRNEELKERQEETLDLLKDSGTGLKDISQLVASLKDFSRLDRQHQAEFDIHLGLESTLKISKNIIKLNSVTVQQEFEDLPLVKCTPSKINQVFLNIITNACQAMKGGGVLIISTIKDENNIKILFKDNGMGMNEETKKKIFDPFYTTKEVGSGTGLGMSVSFKIIEEHKGRIEVESEENNGSNITVVLPIG
ncbi:MAG: hypothetical protein JKY19_08615 [Alcanivoracaceae bacterium]|nr:hypothetical protein [Alcanivoracaceae bacterium]